MTKVKICGIKEVEHGLCAVEAGADYIGFVFANSKRQVTLNQAREIIQSLPDHIQTVGVFVDESLDQMTYIAEYCGLDMLQLHGREVYQDYVDAKFPIVKSVSVKANGEQAGERLPKADYLLFDTWHKDMAGGCGKSFDWKALHKIAIGQDFFLAGGLSVDNVVDAIKEVRPYAVDVSSGVETDGVKDIDKIKAFIKKVKECQ